MTMILDGSAGTIAGLSAGGLGTNVVNSPSIVDGSVTPVKTQAGALPSMVRLNTANGYGSTNTMIRRFTNVVTNQGTDITYADSATLGASFTINTAGVYAVSYTDQFTAVGWVGLSLNSTQLTLQIHAVTSSNLLATAFVSTIGAPGNASVSVFLNVGDVVRPHNSGVGTGPNINACHFIITRVA